MELTMNSAGCVGGLTGWKGSGERPECGRSENSGAGGFFEALARISGGEARRDEARLEPQDSSRTALERKHELSTAGRAGVTKKNRSAGPLSASAHNTMARAMAHASETSIDHSLPARLTGTTRASSTSATGRACPADRVSETGTPFDALAHEAEPSEAPASDGQPPECTASGSAQSIIVTQHLLSGVEGSTLAPGETQTGSDMAGPAETPGQNTPATAIHLPVVPEGHGTGASPQAPATAEAAADFVARPDECNTVPRMGDGEAGAGGAGGTVPGARGTRLAEAWGSSADANGTSGVTPDGTAHDAEPATESRITGTGDSHSVHFKAASDGALSELARAARLAALESRENGVNVRESGGSAGASAVPARVDAAGSEQTRAGSSGSTDHQTSNGHAGGSDGGPGQGGPPPDVPGAERAESRAASRWEQARRSYVEATGRDMAPEPAAVKAPSGRIASPVLLGVSNPVMNHSTPPALSLPPQAEQPSQAGGSSSPPPQETVRQVVRAVSLMWRNGIGEARVSLEPRQLGAATICLRIAHGNVTATLTTSTPEARQHILLNEADLRRALANQGLDLDRLVVTCDPDERDSRWQPARQQPERRPSNRDGGGAQFDVDV